MLFVKTGIRVIIQGIKNIRGIRSENIIIQSNILAANNAGNAVSDPPAFRVKIVMAAEETFRAVAPDCPVRVMEVLPGD